MIDYNQSYTYHHQVCVLLKIMSHMQLIILNDTKRKTTNTRLVRRGPANPGYGWLITTATSRSNCRSKYLKPMYNNIVFEV